MVSYLKKFWSVLISVHCLLSTMHYNDIIMGMMASQITSFAIVYSNVYSDTDQRKHQSYASLALVRGIHQWLGRWQGPVTWKNVSIWWRHHGIKPCHMVVYVPLFLCSCQLTIHPTCLLVMEEGMTGPCLTKTSECCHKPFSQWQHRFHLKAVLPLAKMLVTLSQFSVIQGHVHLSPTPWWMQMEEGRLPLLLSAIHHFAMMEHNGGQPTLSIDPSGKMLGSIAAL